MILGTLLLSGSFGCAFETKLERRPSSAIASSDHWLSSGNRNRDRQEGSNRQPASTSAKLPTPSARVRLNKPMLEFVVREAAVPPFVAEAHVFTELAMASASWSPEPTSPSVITRIPHLDVLIRDPATDSPPVTQQLSVQVYADLSAAALGEAVEPIHLEHPSYVSRWDLNVSFEVSDNLNVIGSTKGQITVLRDITRSSTAEFVVERKPGTHDDAECYFLAYLSYNGRPAGRVQRRAILGSPTQLAVPVHPETVAINTRVPEPDVVVNVFNPKKNNTELKLQYQTRLLDEYKTLDEADWFLPQGSADLLNSKFGPFLHTIDYEMRYRALVGGGKELFDSLPTRCKQMFLKLADEHKQHATMLIVSQEPYIPWELMIPNRHPPDGNLEVQSLGATYSIGRWVLNDEYFPPPTKIIIKNSYVIAPVYVGAKALDAASDEAKFVCENFFGVKIEPADPLTLEATVMEGNRNLLHFACHGASNVGGIGQQVLELQDGASIDSTIVNGMPGLVSGVGKGKPLVFLNACTVGQPVLAFSGVGGFANTFLGLGASAVIAPLWNVDDGIAKEIAVDFYRTLKDDPNRHLADIIRDIRSRAYQTGTTRGRDTYAAYCFYGDPSAVIELSSQQESPDP